LDSLARLEYEVKLNDVWGYVDKLGNEYALVGLFNGMSVVDISNSSEPIEVFRSIGPETIWRDIKVYKNYAYVTNEAKNGMRIYDLSVLPNSYEVQFKDFDGEEQKKFKTAHNLFIDERGRAFVVGTNRNKGMIIYDLLDDPWNPKEIGFYDEEYIHDIYVRNDTAYPALINQGDFSILDISTTNAIQKVSSHPTKDLQTHNTWLSIDGNYLFTTDEVNGAEIGVYDIRDKQNPEKVEFYKSRLLGDEMPHNVLVKDSLAFVSYYKEGLIVLDVSNPENIVEIDRFDTDTKQSGPGFSGAWGVYPFLPSGNILVSDIDNGLFVLRCTIQNASYLEGVVKDKETLLPLNGVNVKVLEDGKEDKTYFDGIYKVGRINSGQLRVEFSLKGYKTNILNVAVSENKILFENILLEKKHTGNLLINLSLGNNESPNGASVSILGEDYQEEINFDSSGVIVNELPEGYYEVYIGKWGYANYCSTINMDSFGDSIFVEMTKDYFDDFSANQGWTVFSEGTNPIWERTQPNPSFNTNTGLQYDPSEDDSNNDCIDWAYCTGINSEVSASETTVNGTNYLVSPEFTISSPNIDATISYSYWLALSEKSNDTVKVGLIHGEDTLYSQKYTVDNDMLEWKKSVFKVNNLFNSFGTFKFIVRVTDDLNPWDMVDFAIDEFLIEFTNSIEEIKSICLAPSDNGWKITCSKRYFSVVNSVGQVIKTGTSDFVDLRGYQSGVYIIKLDGSRPYKIYWNEKKW
jgi:choice-of-anchor B domain-containing protein